MDANSQEPPQQAVPHPPSENPSIAAGVTSLVLGLLALPGAWIPFVQILSIMLAVVGLVFGFVSLKTQGKGMGIAGLILSGLALAICLIFGLIYLIAIIASPSTSSTY